VRRRAVPLLLLVLAAACTGSEPPPSPEPDPTPAEEPAPSGVDVAVVLPPEGDPTSLALVDAEARLDDLAEDRVGDVARIRTVRVDDADFVPDTAALLADGGSDLVCVLGNGGQQVVADLASRFPATRFCAVGGPDPDGPRNVDAFEVAHEELGHVLGTAAALLAAERPVGIVLGDETDERARRRAGAVAALDGAELAVDTAVAGPDEAADLVAALSDAPPLGVVLLDTTSAALTEALQEAAPLRVAPAGTAAEPPATVRWSIRIDTIVGAAVDRVVVPDEPEPLLRLGFAQQLFSLSFEAAVPEEVADAVEVVADELARGVRDPLTPVAGDLEDLGGTSVPTVPGAGPDTD
jgi:hypothetical protein